MKRNTIALAALLGLFGIDSNAAENNTSFGVGAGALYGGIGLNVGLRRENDFRYVAAGCIAFGYGDASGWILPCGVGAGWIWTDLLPTANDRHGLGFYLGPVGIRPDKYGYDDKARYGVGITYLYFFNGVNASGWNVGITPAVGKEDGDRTGSLLINAGYQF